ncbi:DUF6230 family protein [Streptomyces sp. NPDC048416]|uniref:DUF6230 family protein n=1 Tax=Streptomyces sp. NPDC048416 TaxID=3365546 RepID=UPI0037145B90
MRFPFFDRPTAGPIAADGRPAPGGDGPCAAPPTDPPRGTDWRRFALVATIAAVLGVAVVGTTTAVALPVSFAVAGRSFQVSAERLHGVGAVQFAAFAQDSTGSPRPVAIAGINSARITRLCQSSVVHTPLGAITLTIRSDDDEPVTARNLVLDLDHLDGDLRFGHAQLGRDAATLDAVPGVHGTSGAYGQQAQTLDIDQMQLTSWSVTAGSFDLRGAHMAVQEGDHPCF